MEKRLIGISLFAVILLLGVCLVIAQNNDSNGNQTDPGDNQTDPGDNQTDPGDNGTCTEEWRCSRWGECDNGTQTRVCTEQSNCGTEVNKPAESKTCKVRDRTGNETNKTNQGIGQELRERIRELKEEFRSGNYTGPQGQFMNVREIVRGLKEFRVGKMKARTGMNVTAETDEDNVTKLKVKLRNGRNAEIKIMPERASEKALERLRLKVCSEANNCSLELKEVGKGENAKPAYEVQIDRHSRILGLFRAKMKVGAEVDAETGEVTKVKKPWWAFIATEPAEE
jgi:hypothetical protein